MIALGTLSNFLKGHAPMAVVYRFEMVVELSSLCWRLPSSPPSSRFYPLKVWDGREWARILTIIGNAFAAANGVFIFLRIVSRTQVFLRAIGGSSSSASYLVDTVSGTLMIVLRYPHDCAADSCSY